MLYSSGNGLERIKQTLRQDFEIVTKWFYEDYMILNSENVILCVLDRIQ